MYRPSIKGTKLLFIVIKAIIIIQAASGKKMPEDKCSDDIKSKSKRKRKSDASLVEYCHRGPAGGNVWNSLADLLMKLREVGADEKKMFGK